MERLQKAIAQAGITSRRKAENLISDGRVYVNGNQITDLGTKVDPDKDEIKVDGVRINKEEKVYLLLYKPVGVISAVTDDRGRKTVTDYVPNDVRVFPVGRLDYDTSGVLLLTNDGEFANMMMHPSYHVSKTYIAKINGIPAQEALEKLAAGIDLADGMTAPATASLKKKDYGEKTAVIEITIHEGRNRQVRRMFDALGYSVLELKRIHLGPVDVKGMNAGEWRELEQQEVDALRNQALN
ncbi:pseudouridine synthase [Salisediminibacterium halotolerans]|uniref:pseudouridine synthase n=1 Tax=Salisediminibacterium halotolerans TaxID=517425 RepID=UPI000EB4FFCD|nr:pseudouridine synthase [Salisediminibacterium halotolerans]RLJ77990.1 23S rRNA pseudouridine2605 synthase [Actinophytocola xinjiangensis]RPE88672.1 23S rRNA pseudouridine2605 synthase [Salisediminibacterium halotolerans]TWG36967.1 23S rRNA pseudouridine2605 synthase [Salisediminibacterium halotolerans]GEL08420.1 pseudouridine synthase [Salisediminibacterium halotolerans]